MSSRGSTTTLAFDNPSIKPAVLHKLAKQFLANGEKITFLDFDLQFSSMLQNLCPQEYNLLNDAGRLTVLQPTDEILDFISTLATYDMKSGGIMVLDSLNSLQNLLTDDQLTEGQKEANQKTALVITVLQNISRFFEKALLIVNITKQRPRYANQENSQSWERTLVGGRMIRLKSNMIFSVTNDNFDPSVIKIAIRESQDDSSENASEYDFRVSDI